MNMKPWVDPKALEVVKNVKRRAGRRKRYDNMKGVDNDPRPGVVSYLRPINDGRGYESCTLSFDPKTGVVDHLDLTRLEDETWGAEKDYYISTNDQSREVSYRQPDDESQVESEILIATVDKSSNSITSLYSSAEEWNHWMG